MAVALHSSALTRGEILNPVYCTGLKSHQRAQFQKRCPGLAHTVDSLPWWFSLASRKARVALLVRLREAGALALNLSYRLVNEALMDAARDARLPVRVWTVETAVDMRRMVEFGVEEIGRAHV